MTFTLSQFEIELISRTKDIMTEVGFDTTTIDGTNNDLRSPIVFAIFQLELNPANPVSLVDADVASVSYDQWLKFMDFAEYRHLLNLLQHLDDVDVKIGHRQEEFSQLANRVRERSDRLRTHLREEYGYGIGYLEIGFIDLNIDTQGDDTLAETS